MKVGILGSGNVATALGSGFIGEGHDVMLGSRDPDKLAAWIDENGERASGGTFANVAQYGEMLVLAVHGTRCNEAIALAGADNFKGKLVLDATNPLDKSGEVPVLLGQPGDSGGERNQQALPGASVVKAFNTVGFSHFYKPDFPDGPPDMFLCGDDAQARDKVAQICRDFGWNPVDAGGIDTAHYLEAAGMLWITLWRKTGEWDRAFKLLGK